MNEIRFFSSDSSEKNKVSFARIALILSIIFVMSFSSSFAADKNVTILSPLTDSTVEEGNLLLSIKITEPKTVNIEVLEVKKQIVEKDKNSPQKDVVRTAKLKEEDMKKIVSGTYEKLDELVYIEAIPSEEYVSKNTLSFYTKKLEKFNEGVYLISVKTVNDQGKVLETTKSYISVSPKKTEEAIFEEKKSTGDFFQNLLKTIFGA